jgi:RNA polymerase sigma-70 factor (ECF subfamily)
VEVEAPGPNPLGELAISPPTDFDLVRKVSKGDGDAFHELVDRHSRALHAAAQALTGNSADAEDVVQETFAGAYRAAASFERRSSVKTWLRRILLRQVARFYRDRPMKMQGLDAPEAADAPIARGRPSAESGVDTRLDVMSVLQQLSPEHREIIVLRELEQMSYEEMADALGVPRGTVESRLHRARAELKERLGKYMDSK